MRSLGPEYFGPKENNMITRTIYITDPQKSEYPILHQISFLIAIGHIQLNYSEDGSIVTSEWEADEKTFKMTFYTKSKILNITQTN